MKTLQNLVEDVLNHAKEVIQKSADHSLMPMALGIGSGGHKIMPGLFQNDEEKHQFYQEVGSVCKSMGLDIVLLINDAAMREMKTDEEVAFIRKNYDTESPLSYPKSMRTECLIALGHNFHSGEQIIIAQPYKNAEDGSLDFSRKPVSLPQSDSAIVDSILKGWEE